MQDLEIKIRLRPSANVIMSEEEFQKEVYQFFCYNGLGLDGSFKKLRVDTDLQIDLSEDAKKDIKNNWTR